MFMRIDKLQIDLPAPKRRIPMQLPRCRVLGGNMRDVDSRELSVSEF